MFNYIIVPIYWIELAHFVKRSFSTFPSSFLNLYQTGLIAGMLSVVACFSGSPPGKVAHQVAHGLVGLQVLRHLCQRKDPATAALRLAHIREFTVAHVPAGGVSDRSCVLCQDIRRRHRLHDARVLQLLDGLRGVVIRADGRPARADHRIEGDQRVEVSPQLSTAGAARS